MCGGLGCGGSLSAASSTMLKSLIMMSGCMVGSFSIVVSRFFQKLAFSLGVLGAYTANILIFLFSGQFVSKLMALPGEIRWMFIGMDLVLFLFVTMTMPSDLGF